MNLHQIAAMLSKSPPQPFYVIVGDDQQLARETIKHIERSAGAVDTSSSRFSYVKTSEESLAEIFDELRTPPMFGGKRLITLLDDADILDAHKETVIELLSQFPTFSVLVIWLPDAKKNTWLTSFAKKSGSLIECQRPKGKGVEERVKTGFALRKKTISREAILGLLACVGDDPSILDSEIDKVSIYAGKNPRVTLDDVRQVACQQKSYTAFQLCDAISSGRADAAVGIACQLLSGEKSAEEIMGAIAWHFRRLLTARKMLSEGKSPAEIGRKLRIHEYFLDKFLAQVQSTSEKKITDSMDAIVRADVELKTSHTSPERIINLLTLKLCTL